MRSHAICFGLTVLIALQSGVSAFAEGDAASSQGSAAPLAGTRIPLGCTIVDGSVVAITNTTGQPVPEGAEITYDGFNKAYGEHYGATFASKGLAPGQIIRKKASKSASCHAWFTQPAAAAPTAASEPAAAPSPSAEPAPAVEPAPAAQPAQ